MEAKNFRVGNIITLKDNEWNEVIRYFDLYEISNDKCKYATIVVIANEVELKAYGCNIDFYDYAEIVPILINEYWLIRFGFKKKSEGVSTLNAGAFYFECIRGEGMYLESIGIDIIYIHELQNLFFALTGEELVLVKD